MYDPRPSVIQVRFEKQKHIKILRIYSFCWLLIVFTRKKDIAFINHNLSKNKTGGWLSSYEYEDKKHTVFSNKRGEHMMYVGLKETDSYAGNFVSCGEYCYREVQFGNRIPKGRKLGPIQRVCVLEVTCNKKIAKQTYVKKCFWLHLTEVKIQKATKVAAPHHQTDCLSYTQNDNRVDI